ncbi:MAG: CDGSH iron-sulfur domain-containing protein [Bacteroidales bacterium]|nr:CDGSH iron-sulfur domain-containing protein [Bacteroidales bacterium]
MDTPKIAKSSPFVLDMEAGTYFWCSCGKSAKQPFCDGSHKGSEFRPVKTVLEEPKKAAWCGCKHSANKPFCDGAHAKL